MRRDSVNLLLLAVACNLPRDEAYDLLNVDVADRFIDYYSKFPDDEQKPTVIDAMISFSIRELPAITELDGDVRFSLSSRREQIIDALLNCRMTQMITQLASRSTILEMIRSYLRKENKQYSMYGKLNSTRVSEVFNDFLAEFETNCAYAFRFTGTFKDFVMNCFINFYYKGHKKDIWDTIRKVDTARREIEQSVVQERVVHAKRTDDILIHDLVLNVHLLNNRMFYHSGQSEEVHGICYDTYYLLLCELCKNRVDQINRNLGEDILEFVDPLDRKEARLGMKSNKGIAAKIANAKELLVPVFDYVRSGRLNTSDLVELRDKCFKLGKHDREGRNCVWKDVSRDSETSRYLDTPMAASNYAVFDLIVKGVVSASTLMSEIESRGMCLVDTYAKDLFNDSDIVRYIDYLSSIKYLDLIKRLQSEPVDYSRYGKDLLEFPDMVNEYAGSSVNNHTNIRENRYYAITHGFLDKPRLKQTTVLKTRYEKLKALANCFDSVPRSARDFVLSLDDARRQQWVDTTWTTLPGREVISGKYSSLYTNIYVNENPEAARYYLHGDSSSLDSCLDSLGWTVGTGMYSVVIFNGQYGLYLPMHGRFMFCAADQSIPTLVSIEQLVKEVMNSGNRISLAGGLEPLQLEVDSPVVGMYAKTIYNSIGFSYEVGLENLMSSNVQTQIAKIQMTDRERKYAEKYFSWLDELSHLQHSMIAVLKIITTESIFLLYDSQNYMEQVGLYRKCRALMHGVLTGEFDSESLNWILSEIAAARDLQDIDFSKIGQANVYQKIDISILDYCFGRVDRKSRGVYKEVVDILDGGEYSPADAFVILYNYIYTKLEFLRYVRDAYSLVINVAGIDASTLVCELVQRFNIAQQFYTYRENTVKHGATSDKVDYASAREFIISIRERCLQEFKTVVDELMLYIQDCEQDIAKLVDYSIAAREEVKSKFSDIGQAFNMLPAYPEVPQLTELKGIAKTDSSGFFMLGGTYFHGKNGGLEYYVHRSGRMVVADNGVFKAADFNLEESTEDMKKYRAILTSGLRAV